MKTRLSFFAAAIITVICAACGNTVEQHEAKNDRPAAGHQPESSYYEKQFREIRMDETIGNRELSAYLSDPQIPAVFKTVFTGKGNMSEHEDALPLTDSIFSRDTERQPFYFILFTRAIWWADGAFAEPLYLKARQYVSEETTVFLAAFRNEKVLTDADFKNWADAVAMEIGISDEHHEQDAIDKLEKQMLDNCSSCSAEDRQLIKRFIQQVRAYSA